MYPKIYLMVILLTGFTVVNAQYVLSGKVTSPKGEPLQGVSISIKESYYGSTSVKDGSFRFSVPDSGQAILVFSSQGYKTAEKSLHININTPEIIIVLKEEITEMQAVVVSAGVFEASDKKRTTVFKSVDMVTIAGQQADIIGALKTLPGAQQIGEQEGLFVRGGTGSETKVFMDGMMLNNPFFSSVPGIAQRSRYSPLLFKGTVFSTGAYSAQYGQALSSVLLLESIDLPSRSEVNMIISSAQQSVLTQSLNKKKNESLGFNINYTNLAPYFSAVPQKYHYTKAPETINVEWNFRKKWKSGILKLYTYASHNRLGFERPSLDHSGMNESFVLKNAHLFSNATYSVNLKNRWQWFSGMSVSLNKDKIKTETGAKENPIRFFYPVLTNRSLQFRSTITKTFAGLSKIYLGIESQNNKDGIQAKDSINKRSINDHYMAAFIETDVYYSSRLVSKAGLRFEHSTLLNKYLLSPRLSLAYKLNSISQVSFAYGKFYQKPEVNYLLRRQDLDFSQATHYLMNYQRINKGQTFRTELFYKKYRKLITTGISPFEITNEGYGDAKGVEIFWRDKTSLKNFDYWVSYSFLDTKRKFLDYPQLVQPSFAAKHTFNIVAKRFVTALSTQFSANYNFATGRPYFNPSRNDNEFMKDRTISYHSLGLQANYLRTFGKVNAVFIVNVSNVLGSKQVYNYRFASRPAADGSFASEAITPMAKRFVFLGAYLSIGSDRRKEILD